MDPRKCRAEFEVVWLCSFQIGYFKKKIVISVSPRVAAVQSVRGEEGITHTHRHTCGHVVNRYTHTDTFSECILQALLFSNQQVHDYIRVKDLRDICKFGLLSL